MKHIYLYQIIISDSFKLVVTIILGIIEGITEFLPISSTGHLILVKNYLNYSDESIQILIVIIQFGTILSTLIIFKKRLYTINTNCIKNIFIKKHYQYNHLCIYHIILGTIPGVLVGIVFYEKIKLLLSDSINIMYGLIVGSIFLLVGEGYLLKSPLNRISNINKISYFQSFLIGCFQCLSFYPGFSRSGSTIAGGLLVKLNRSIALEFSFLLSVPITLGSITLTLYHYHSYINRNDIIMLIIGSIISFMTSLFTIRFLLKIVQYTSLIPFIIYRILLAAIIYWVLNNK